MDVILDTNIYQANFSLRSNEMDSLSAYLKKTGDKLVIPYIVAQELTRNYKSTLKRSIKDIELNAHGFHNCTTTEELKAISTSILSLSAYKKQKLEVDAKSYLEFVKDTMPNVVIQDLPPLIDTGSILKMALDKEKPFKLTGEGFKDAVLWKSLLSHCSTHAKRIVFISNNSKDFGKNKLESNLLTQMDESNASIVFYNNLSDFINNEFKTIENIDFKIPNIDIEELKILVEDRIQEGHFDLETYYAKNTTDDIFYHSFQGIKSLEIMGIPNSIIKDPETDFFYLYANVICKAEFVLLGETYRAFTNELTGDFNYEPHTDFEMLDSYLRVAISLRIKNQNFEELEVTEVKWLPKI